MEQFTIKDSTIAFIGLGLIGGANAPVPLQGGSSGPVQISALWPICGPAPN